VVVAVRLPEVPVTVTVEVPLGVPLYGGGVEVVVLSPHPMPNINAAITIRVITRDPFQRFPGIRIVIPISPKPSGIQEP
jgi:hypothetical protein